VFVNSCYDNNFFIPDCFKRIFGVVRKKNRVTTASNNPFVLGV
jgi:hypothetical protein